MPTARTIIHAEAQHDVVTVASGGERVKEMLRAVVQAPHNIYRAAAATSEPFNFMARELRSRLNAHPTRRWNETPQPRCTYALKGGVGSVAVEHGTEDAWVMADVIAGQAYAAPLDQDLRLLAGLEHRPTVVDIGGHIGCFGIFAQGRYRPQRVISYEPDARNRYAIDIASHHARCEWTVRPHAAGATARTARFASGRSSRSGISAYGDSEVQVVDCFDDLRQADIIKLDCEGAEWELLADARFAELRPTLLVLEYHLDDQDPHEVGADAGNRVRSLICPSGFELFAAHAITSRSGLVWATR